MHMADALLSPAVGGAMWAASAGAMVCCARRLRRDPDDRKLPLMGVLGAFVFAVQMINFTIPGTGSSGHLGGGLLLAALLGPSAAFIAMASVLTVQALFFGDGGLLALGSNIFNLGVFPCLFAYPLIFSPIAGGSPSRGRILAASLPAAIVGLQLGALAVVLETVLSGISELPFGSFALLMQPIHLTIGVVEGVVTAAMLTFVRSARPELLASFPADPPLRLRGTLIVLAAAAVLTGGVLCRFASTHPDGLEWSIAALTGREEPAGQQESLHRLLAGIQESTSLLPGYRFREHAPAAEAAQPVHDSGASVSGLVGGLLTLVLAALAGLLLKRRAGGTGC